MKEWICEEVPALTVDGKVIDTMLLMKKELVKCQGCKYGQYFTDGEATYRCSKWNSGEFGMLHEQNWFCADAERKTE